MKTMRFCTGEVAATTTVTETRKGCEPAGLRHCPAGYHLVLDCVPARAAAFKANEAEVVGRSG